MDNWWSILIDLGVLALLGIAYYFYQKKRIIRVSREEILADVDQFRLELNKFSEEFLTESDDLKNQALIKKFNNEFELSYQNSDYNLMTSLDPNCLDEHLKSFYHALCKQIFDHLKVSKEL